MTSTRHKTSTAPIAEDVLLDAAREAILAVGWSRTTLTDIARRAGVSRMTIYRKWPDMQALLADLMTREWTAAVGTTLASDVPGRDARTRIVEGVVATVRALRANPLLGRIIELDPELLLPYLLDRRGRSQDLVADVLAGLVRAGQEDGSVRAGNPDTLGRSVLLAVHGFTLSAHTMLPGTQRRGARVDTFDAELRELLERYLRP
jgi:AcrR family transcriptional regulator